MNTGIDYGAFEIVYLDPPWESSQWQQQGPSLGNELLGPFVAELLRRQLALTIIIKLPRQADIDKFDSLVGSRATRYAVNDARKGTLSYWLIVYRA